ncbi:PqiC family protein [Desulfovibrio inopinatus]|uniref:PqiC family protein n=1 Tax=Desulfovibrio inopinatus TaxID=102109 RepID=UPI00040A7B26|nr:PqiC family protein [Desulfovibrio inopinatus]
MRRHVRIPLLLSCVLLIFLLAGCGMSAPTHFYTLSPAESTALDESKCISVGVGPVRVASYLDRDSIVTRNSANQLHVAEFDEWAEPLQDGLANVVAENIQGLICTQPITVHPWPIGISPAYQVTIQVQRLDGTLGKDVTLQATWSIVNAEGAMQQWQTFSQHTACGLTYNDLAASASQLIAEMSKDIATALKTLQSKEL